MADGSGYVTMPNVNVVEEMAIAAGVPMPKVYLINDSAPNAFATGRDPKHASVAITTGLREKLTRDELQGVMAHEISHIRNYDIRLMLLMAVLIGTVVMLADMFWPGENPIGRSVHCQVLARASGIVIPEERPREIVGVVGDLKYPSTFGPSPAAMYVPQSQHEWLYPGGTFFTHISKKLVIRTAPHDQMRLARQVREAAARIDAECLAIGLEVGMGHGPMVGAGRLHDCEADQDR